MPFNPEIKPYKRKNRNVEVDTSKIDVKASNELLDDGNDLMAKKIKKNSEKESDNLSTYDLPLSFGSSNPKKSESSKNSHSINEKSKNVEKVISTKVGEYGRRHFEINPNLTKKKQIEKVIIVN